MTRLSLLSLIAASVVIPRAFAQYTTTIVAGGGPPDGLSALSVGLADVEGIAADNSGNVFIVSSTQNRVFKVASNGSLTTLAGNGTLGFSGDSGPSKSSQLADPVGVAVDGAGDVYIGDSSSFCCSGGNYRIRKVSGGNISTVAGDGIFGESGDGGPATSAMIGSVSAVAADSSGTLYIADSSFARVRKISSGIITTVAGNGVIGYSGDGGPAIAAQIGYVYGLAADNSGNLYIADSNCRSGRFRPESYPRSWVPASADTPVTEGRPPAPKHNLRR